MRTIAYDHFTREGALAFAEKIRKRGRGMVADDPFKCVDDDGFEVWVVSVAIHGDTIPEDPE